METLGTEEAPGNWLDWYVNWDRNSKACSGARVSSKYYSSRALGSFNVAEASRIIRIETFSLTPVWWEPRLTIPLYTASQWPGTAGGFPPNTWQYELVVLGQDANLKKTHVRFKQSIMTLANIARYGAAKNFSKTGRRREQQDEVEPRQFSHTRVAVRKYVLQW